MRKTSKQDCIGCRDDFYNHNRMGLNEASGEPRCWSLDDAKFVQRVRIGINERPPYRKKPVKVLNCRRENHYALVSPDALDENGFWKRRR